MVESSNTVMEPENPQRHPLWEQSRPVIRAAFEAAEPHLEPMDFVCILVLSIVHGPRSHKLWPRGKPPTSKQAEIAYRTALVTVADRVCGPGRQEAALLPDSFEPTPEGLQWLWEEFWTWHDTVLMPVVQGTAPREPRFEAIGLMLGTFRRAGFSPTIFKGDLVQGVINQGRRKGRLAELGANPTENLTREDVLNEMVALDSLKSMILDWDEGGRSIIVPNFAAVFDQLASVRRDEPTPLSLDGTRQDADLETLGANVRDEHSDADPAEVVQAIELVEQVRALRDLCRDRGPATEAALACLIDGQTRRAAGAKHGVTAKQIRVAEDWIKATIINRDRRQTET